MINSRGQNMPRGGRNCAEKREKQREQGPTGGGGVAERGRGERRDRGRSDRRENDERSGMTAGWHKVAARIGEGLQREIERGRRPMPVAAGSRISDVFPQGGCVPGSGDEGRGRRPRVDDG